MSMSVLWVYWRKKKKIGNNSMWSAEKEKKGTLERKGAVQGLPMVVTWKRKEKKGKKKVKQVSKTHAEVVNK